MTETPMDLHFLDPMRVRLRLDDCGFLLGTVGGAEVSDVRARKAFPFHHPEEYVELRDGADALLGFIRTLDALSDDTAAAVREAARLHHFVPLVTRILSIDGAHHVYVWSVETDRGVVQFHTRGRRQNIEEISGDEYIVTATDGNRYRIPGIPQLDGRSLAHLRKVL